MPIVLGTVVVVIFGLMPASLMSVMQAAAVPMLTSPVVVPPVDPAMAKADPEAFKARPAEPVQLHAGTDGRMNAGRSECRRQVCRRKARAPRQRQGCRAERQGRRGKGKGAAPNTRALPHHPGQGFDTSNDQE